MAGLRSKRLAFNAEAVERELLGGAGAMRLRAAFAPFTGLQRAPAHCRGWFQQGPAAFACDVATGLVSFLAGHIPPPGAAVAAGFEFDVPVRFATGRIDVNLSAFNADASRRSP